MAEAQSVHERESVLVVDDEPNIRETIAVNLRINGFEVMLAADGEQALAALEFSPDVVVLDIMLPGIDGLEVCRRMRRVSNVPILLLSAKGEEIDRVVGLEVGADDYLTKPFAMRELVARVRAMVRRSRMNAEPTSQVDAGHGNRSSLDVSGQGDVLRNGDLEILLGRRQAFLRGVDLGLKPKEFDLLVYLVRHSGTVLSRDALLREVWGYEFRVDTRTVDVHISWLRQKLEDDPGKPQRLLTVRGHGYRYQPVPADA